jgi:DNA-directed RNA polymerase specialized sigma24 family protein
MSSSGSITHWISRLKSGDPAAAQKLWEAYFHRLVGLARKRLQGAPRRAADEEDVALSAFASFCRRAERGQFPRLHDRDDLWHLLMVITTRKALDQARHGRRQKRGGVAPNPGPLPEPEATAEELALDQLTSPEPTPEFAAQVADECRRLLDRLGTDELRAIAVWKMEGYSNEEIAALQGWALRTVERRLRVIRSLWSQESMP